MGIFSRIKNGISSKANSALDKAIDPQKEVEMTILELEEGRKKALQELVSYKATAKTLDADMEKHRAKAAEWEKRAMMAVKAGDDEAAKTALKEKRNAETEANKIERDKHEAASYAIQLNKSRKEFETKLQILKLRKGTLATQIAAGRSAGGDAFGNDSSVWDKFKAAEDRIDAEAIETEVDAAMRGEMDGNELDLKIAAAQRAQLAAGGDAPAPAGPDDALAQLKSKMDEAKAAKQKALAAGAGKDDKPGERPARSGAEGTAKLDKPGEGPARSGAEGTAKLDKPGERPARSGAEGTAKLDDKK